MEMKSVTDNPDLKIGTILQAARVRSGKTRDDIATAAGVSARMVSMWERDKRGIGRGKGIERTEKIFTAYKLTEQEQEEVVRRISLRKQEYLADSLATLLGSEKSSNESGKISQTLDERQILIHLLALSPEKRRWVIETVNAHLALK